MAKITRQTMQMFGSSMGGSDCGIFGSLAAGSPTYSAVIATIQSLPAWSTGWAAETIATNRPALEDMNAVCHVLSYGVSYLHEMGIPEYDASTVYYENSYCQVAGVIYYSLQDNNLNNTPASSPTFWTSGVKGISVVPSGLISMWYGNIASIPSGWYLCDGNNGTPDLRDRFVVGASSDDGGVAKTIMTDGATKTKSGASNFAAHTHPHLGPTGESGGSNGHQTNDPGYNNSGIADTQDPTGSAGSGTVTYPPYYALAFIMKA